MADTGALGLTFKEVTGFFIQSSKDGQLFVIKGVVTNNYPQIRSFILLKGNLLDDNGRVVRRKVAYAGNTFMENQIKKMTLDEINKGLKERFGKRWINFNIKPGGTIPFMIIFEGLPENLSGFTVEAASSSPEKLAADELKKASQEEIKREINKITNQLKYAPQRELEQKIEINVSQLNVRAGPDATYSIISIIKLHDRFLVLEKRKGWVKIQLDSNRDGWVFDKYVKYLDIEASAAKEIEPQKPTPPKKMNYPAASYGVSKKSKERSKLREIRPVEIKPQKPAPAKETKTQITTPTQTDFLLFRLKSLCLILLIISILALSIMNKKSGLKNWWTLPLISLMVLVISLSGMLSDLHYELGESIKLWLALGCLIGAIAISYVSSSRWTFVLLLFGGLPLLALVLKVFGFWIGTILLFLTIWIYGLFIRKSDGKTKSERATIIIKHVPIIIVGLSYIVVAGWVIIQKLVAGDLVSHIIPYVLWVLLGIALLYKRKFAIILSLISYPSLLALNIFFLPILVKFLTPVLYSPFHHISFMILQKYALLSTVKPYWTAYLWGIYTIHSICLLPYLFKKSKKVHGPKKATIKFRFPEVVDIYQKNAFQVLGIIPQEATIRAITKRKKDLSALIGSDLAIKEHLHDYHAIPWSEDNRITEADINNAYSRLQDNLKRMKEELFWFHLEEGNDEAFRCLLDGEFEKGVELWKAKKENDPQSYSTAQALYNLAVLDHALVLTQERATVGNPCISNAQIENWKRVFSLWIEVHGNNKCWDYYQKRVIYIYDHRINDRYLRRLRKELPSLILNINLELAQAALKQDMFNYAKQTLNLIRESGFDSREIDKVIEAFCSLFVRELKAIMQNLENHPNDKEKHELYKEYKFFLKKALKVKDLADKLDVSSYIKLEIEEIISIPRKQVKDDLNLAIDYVNILIRKWQEAVNGEKLSDLKDAVNKATDITIKGNGIFRIIKDLCCDVEDKSQVKSDNAWLDAQREALGTVVSSVKT